MLLVVNPDSNSLTLVNTVTLRKVVEIPVGVNPRSVAVENGSGRVYVSNQGSDSISIIDLESHSVTDEITTGDRPAGVAVSPDDRLLAVTVLGDDTVRLFNTGDFSLYARVSLPDRPYGLAFTPDGCYLLVTHLLSGQVSTVAMNGLTVSSIDTWFNVAPAPAVVVNSAGTRAFLPQTMAHGLGLNTQFDNTVFPKVSVLDLTAGEHRRSEHISLPEKDQPVGLPWHVALAKEDTELWVVNAASNDVSVLDISNPTRAKRVAHIPVSDNPRGIVISPDGSTAYVNNTLAGTVSVIDASRYEVIKEVKVTNLPLPPVLLAGKRLFHTSVRSDIAKASWISCNTCHIEEEHDGRTWLLQYIGEVPVGSDPVVRRNTTGLLGMIETYPLRWSAEWDESADSEFSIRFEQFGTGLIDGEMHPTLGEPNQGRAYELDCLAAYIDSLRVPQRQHVLTDAEARGEALFASEQVGCAVCHPGPLYTDLKQHDVGTVDGKDAEWFGPLIDTPTLRFLYDSAPYFHDGSADTLVETITFPSPNGEHDVTDVLSEEQMDDLIRFLLILPYDQNR
jgi:YVTN family beta-propeller protein